jgi:hypothetical protein
MPDLPTGTVTFLVTEIEGGGAQRGNRSAGNRSGATQGAGPRDPPLGTAPRGDAALPPRRQDQSGARSVAVGPAPSSFEPIHHNAG